LDRLDEDVAKMREFMSRAGEAVTGGLRIRTDAEVVKFPNRYSDERGRAMWGRVMGLLEKREA
jgi:DNA polymerase I